MREQPTSARHRKAMPCPTTTQAREQGRGACSRCSSRRSLRSRSSLPQARRHAYPGPTSTSTGRKLHPSLHAKLAATQDDELRRRAATAAMIRTARPARRWVKWFPRKHASDSAPAGARPGGRPSDLAPGRPRHGALCWSPVEGQVSPQDQLANRTRSIDYDTLGHGYSRHRRADPRIASRIHAALGGAKTVVNVGAGAGSYEPTDRYVLAVEPSATMRAQRAAQLAPAISGRAESLPLDDRSVDAAMAILTLHHWDDPVAGLCELRRVARDRVVVVTFDVDVLERYWLLADYLPEALADDRARFLPIDEITAALDGPRVENVAVPADCTDGFFEAYYARPEALLDPGVRASQSAWPRLPPGVEQRAIAALAADLESGAWDRRHGHLRQLDVYDAALRLVIATRRTTNRTASA